MTSLGMRTIVFVAVTFYLSVVTKLQDSTCDVSTSCSCCIDGGFSCVNDPLNRCAGPCKDGYDRCLLTCPAECVSCHQSFGVTKECHKCINGRYGKSCTEVCSSCLSCNRDTGVCIDCGCSQTCVNRHCDRESGKCYDCIVGYYGDMCNDKCSDTCRTTLCNSTSGVCQQCVTGNYGEYCNMTCSEKCLDMCDVTTGICINCIAGTYGSYCNINCPPSCSGFLCERVSGTCTNGCVENFDGNLCEDCITGKHGTKCDLNCPSNCLHGVCTRNNGTCASGCKIGYSDSHFCCANNTYCDICSSQSEYTQCIFGKYGRKCEHNCPDNCEGPCTKSNGNCNHCKLNYYGSTCDNQCSETCFTTEDQISRCVSGNGNCQFGCISGFYGNMCERSCSEYCNDTCDQTSGECHNCKHSRYGNNCEHLCFHACVRSDSETVCNTSTGVCLHSCLHGYYGNKCDRNCSLGCRTRSCDRHTGHCSNGCAENFSGRFCVAAMIQPDSRDSTSVTVGVSLGVATAVLLVGTVVFVLFRKRILRLLKRRDLPQSSPTYDDLNTDLRATNAAYSDVSYDNANNDSYNRVYINTTVQQRSDATEPGLYVNML